MRLQTKLTLLIFSLLSSSIIIAGLYFQFLISRTLTQQLGDRVLAIAETVASMPEIRQAFSARDPSLVIQPIAEKVRAQTGAEFVVVGNKDKIRYSHPVPDRIGEIMVGKDNDQALQGKAIISEAKGTLGPSLRGIAPILAKDGQVIGIVAVGFSLKEIENITENYRNKIFLIALLIIGFGIFGALMIARGVKKAILGLEPAEITNLYREKKAVIESIKEGILAVDLEGTVSMVNQQALNMLRWESEKEVLGRNILELSPYSPLMEIIRKGEAAFDKDVLLNDEFFIANYMPIRDEKDQVTGYVSSFRSKSELSRLSQELFQVTQYSEALRAQTHEFSNKLYMISGLIQLESYQEAIELITREFDIHENLFNFIRQEIPDLMIGGLLIGKFNKAKELRIGFDIDRESSFKDIPEDLDRDALASIIGNLVDNAMDAVMKPEAEGKKIEISFTDYGKDLIIEIEDSGIGIPPENRTRIFDKGFSTKAESNHGLGLFLVRKTVAQMNGYISCSPNPYGGSIFTVAIPKSQAERK